MPGTAIEVRRSSSKVVAATRIDALDWTKGALILFMVLYHAINYSFFRSLAFRFLAFLPPSFILITGFLVGHVYAAKYDPGSSKPYARLASRGVKLLLVFTCLNLAHFIFVERSFFDGLSQFLEHSPEIFFSGNGRAAIFEVLLPIAYFLLLAPALLWLRIRAAASIAYCAGLAFLGCLVLDFSGNSFKNLTFLSIGLIGMALGLFRLQTIDKLAGNWVFVITVYVLYRATSLLFGESYPVQTVAAIVSVLLLYACALRVDTGAWIARQMVILGQYSLLGYLVQIAVLQFIVRIFGGPPNQGLTVSLVAAAATVVTFAVVRVVHELRNKNRTVAVTYKFIFA